MSRTARKLVALCPSKAVVLAAVAFGAALAAPAPDGGRRIAAGGVANNPPGQLSRNDLRQIQRSLQESRYHAKRAGKPGEAPVLSASNPRQGYRTTFGREGIELVQQGPPGVSWRLGVSITGYGYAGHLRPLQPAEPRAEKDKVEYRRGPVTEWYVNRPGGLEQGFELAEPQPRRGEPLVVAMAVEGDLDVTSQGDGASFSRHHGDSLVRYAGLKAWDAEGRPLEARVEVVDREVRLIVEARSARFPVTVDPTFVRQGRLFGHGDPVGQPGAECGFSVSVSGDTAVVGVPYDDTPGGADTGSAYVFVRSGATWTEQQKLLAADGAAGDLFGTSVSVSGDTVVVGAYAADTPAGVNAGAAYVFVRSEAAWTQQLKLLPSDGAAGDSFGYSVSIDADTVVAGAVTDTTPGGALSGSAYVFVRSGMAWSEQQKLVASDAAADDLFGVSVSISVDTVAVGAYADDFPGGTNAGSVYVFARSAATWTQQQKLLASDGAPFDFFGVSVSVSGDTVVAGAYRDTNAGGVGAGSAYAFVRSGGSWTEQQKLVASDPQVNKFLGFSVSVSGDTAVAGAYLDDNAGGVDAGAAHVFVRSGTTWTEQRKLLAPDGAASDWFGSSVSASGDTVVAGAYLADVAGAVDAGAAYVFARSGTDWTEQQKLLASDAVTAGDDFGYSVSASGDTVVVGAPRDDTPDGTDAGSAYVFVRSGTTWSEQRKLVASDGAAGDLFGSSVSASADTVVVGAYAADTPGGVNAGAAYVFVRTGAVWAEQQKLLAPDGASNASFGYSVSVSGDTVVVGAPTDDAPGGALAGSAYVFVRSGPNWAEQQKLLASDAAADDLFGVSASVSGDTVVVGAYGDDTPGGVNAGSAYVFARSGGAWSEQQKLLAPDAAAGDVFGFAVSLSGETAVVGAHGDDTPGGVDAGSAYVFVRSGTTWTEQQKLLSPDAAAGDLFGASVSVSGDIVVIGACWDDALDGEDAGAAYVFVRSDTKWTDPRRIAARDGTVDDLLGAAVSVSGDTLIVGAPRDDTPGAVDAGSALVRRRQAPPLPATGGGRPSAGRSVTGGS